MNTSAQNLNIVAYKFANITYVQIYYCTLPPIRIINSQLKKLENTTFLFKQQYIIFNAISPKKKKN